MTSTSVAKRLYRSADPALRYLPEGPYPLDDGRFSWIAIQHGAESGIGSLNVFDLPSGNNRSHIVPGRPGFAFPCDDGESYVIGCERQVGLFNPIDASWKTLAESVDGNVENTIINDGVVFENNLIFGTKDLEFKTKKAGLYLYRGSDSKLIALRTDQICSNGKAVIRDGEDVSLIDIDSPTGEIVRYRLDIENGTISDRTVLIDLSDDPAVPDGLIMTPDGSGIIISMFNPNFAPHGETRWYDIGSGRLRHTWQTPGSPQNTCPNLISYGGTIHLVITTAVEHMPADQEAECPEAGSLFIAPTEFETVGDAPRFPMPSVG